MTDTPEHIKQLQLDLWLQKTPGERLEQFLRDNEAMYEFWNSVKVSVAEELKKRTSPWPQKNPTR